MTGRFVRSLLAIGAILALPVMAYAQEAVLTGTVTDSTGAVLPGVTVTAVHEATGNRFVGITDERGIYRVSARVGGYQLTAELQGFTTAARTGVEVLVGQVANINMQMAPSSVQETVTVSAEAPLLDITTSSLGGNVDPRQVSELPIQGRNWMALAMVAPGSRVTSDTATTPLPDRNGGEQPEYQFAIDGQQVNSEQGYGGQPRYSQDSIAEFQFISNRFDATMGRSTAVQVIAITRSGTNALNGSVRGNFRDSRFNARNPVLDRVVPIDNQQVAFTLGGPILRDKFHFFSHFEYEREPRTSVWNTPYPRFNVDLAGNQTVKMGGLRMDYQLSPGMRLMGKASEGRRFEPFGAGNNTHPAATGSSADINREYLGQLTQVLSNRAVNEIKGGYTKYKFDQKNITTWSNHWQAFNGVTTGSPRITFSNFTIGGNSFYPRFGAQDSFVLRDDFTLSFSARGRHDLRAGMDYLRMVDSGDNCQACMGQIDARNGPTPANIEALFPDAFNADTWNLAAISSLTRNYRLGVGDFATHDVRPKVGAWLQDDWQISSNLTLNLGLRYDLSVNAQANNYAVPPFIEAGRPNDTNNIQPRLGAAYRLGERTVVRGGSGLYFAEPLAIDTFWMAQAVRLAVIEVTNDGRANFAADPFNGQPLPTLEQANQRFCHVRNVPGCLQRSVAELIAPEEFSTHLARTWQSSIGVARQVGSTMAFEVDYVYSKGDHEKDIIDNTNLTFNPATGGNYPFSDVSRRAFPQFGLISMSIRTGWSSYHALQTSFTKRLSNRWQGSATYTLSGLKNAEAPPMSGLQPVPFATAPDLGGEFTFDPTDQRHRAVFNGIWQVGRGFQMSGLYFVLVGERSATNYGGDVRGFGATGSARLRPDGTIVPRNNFTQPARKRFDLRAQQRIPLPGRVAIDAIAEVFNLFNSPNFTINTTESNAQFNRATSGQNRTAQLGFRLTF
jgi:carboxypeptidase family protein/TonB-dependent receptor-like protein